jgi:hypothetical protein
MQESEEHAWTTFIRLEQLEDETIHNVARIATVQQQRRQRSRHHSRLALAAFTHPARGGAIVTRVWRVWRYLAKRYGRSSIAATRGSKTSSGSFNAVYKPTIINRKHAIDREGVVDSRNAVTGWGRELGRDHMDTDLRRDARRMSGIARAR